MGQRIECSYGPSTLSLRGPFHNHPAPRPAVCRGGYRLGRTDAADRSRSRAGGAMVGATLGLIAFMLAFTFGLAAARFDTRRQVLLDEANAIGTTYLRAGMLPDRREAIRALLRDYVDTRLEAVRSGKIAEGIAPVGAPARPTVGARSVSRRGQSYFDCRWSLRPVAQ
jgi:hypothetical protein